MSSIVVFGRGLPRRSAWRGRSPAPSLSRADITDKAAVLAALREARRRGGHQRRGQDGSAQRRLVRVAPGRDLPRQRRRRARTSQTPAPRRRVTCSTSDRVASSTVRRPRQADGSRTTSPTLPRSTRARSMRADLVLSRLPGVGRSAPAHAHRRRARRAQPHHQARPVPRGHRRRELGHGRRRPRRGRRRAWSSRARPAFSTWSTPASMRHRDLLAHVQRDGRPLAHATPSSKTRSWWRAASR